LEYDLAAKTGTAQIPNKEGPGYNENFTNDTVIGFAPSDEP